MHALSIDIYGHTIDRFHKSQNARVPYPIILHSEQKYFSVLNGALWDMEQGHSGMCELGQVITFLSVHFFCYTFLKSMQIIPLHFNIFHF